MKISRELKKKEALARMQMWGISELVIEQLSKHDLVLESVPPIGACYHISKEQRERIHTFEKKHNALVYHVVHSYTNIGEMESFLYVGEYEEEWEMDHRGIEQGEQLVYVYNKDAPDCSEFGSIGIELTPAGGLQRIW